MALLPEDRELVLQLLEDIDALERGRIIGLPSSDELRTTVTPILRRWIVDGIFFQIQRLLPTPITFVSYSRTDAVKACKAGAYKWWMGLVDCGQNLMLGPGALSGKFVGNEIKNRGSFKITQKPKLFFSQEAFWWKGRFYSRSDLIKFSANKLGGVHYDLARNQSETHIEEIQNHFAILYEHEKRNILVVPPAEIPKYRADPILRRNLYDAIQLSVGDTAMIFCSGIRVAEKELRSLL